MLRQLHIQNYAIIDELKIALSDQLNIITGETGAGKSILMGALNLILGGRADSSVLVDKHRKCVVEGSFQGNSSKEINEFFSANDLDFSESELIIRREIGSNGKSRAFINDTPVNLNQLQQLSSLLVDLHQQFDTLELGESDFQREVLDALAGSTEQLGTYQQIYRQWQTACREVEQLQSQKQQFDKEAGYHQFQFDELNEAGFKENELEETDLELKMLSNAEGIKAALSKVYFELEESESPMVQQLKSLANQLHSYESYHPQLKALIGRMHSAQIEIQDIADEVDRISNQVNYEPARITQLNERLSTGYKLQKKHGVSSTNDLIAIQRQLEQKLQAVLNIDDAIQAQQKNAASLFEKANKIASKISDARHKQVKPFEEKVNKLLKQVGMPNARLRVQLTDDALNATGTNRIDFLFNANLPSTDKVSDNHFQPIRKVASGGELSRLMLCIKSLVAQKIDLPTMIFDEIDTGISGEAARQVGIILKDLAGERQVICITHQPQIAGKATAHFFVYKDIVGNFVKTNIRQLSTDERITAIAKMLSGEKPTAAAIENAREMIGN